MRFLSWSLFSSTVLDEGPDGGGGGSGLITIHEFILFSITIQGSRKYKSKTDHDCENAPIAKNENNPSGLS